jgi:predicted nucleotidyltransferase
MATRHVETQIIPTKQDFEKILKAKKAFEAAQSTPDRDTWNKKHFNYTPWGIAWKVSIDPRAKVKNEFEGTSAALRYFIAAVIIGWDDLILQLKRTLQKWGYTKEDMQYFSKIWNSERVADILINVAKMAVTSLEIDELKTDVKEQLEVATALTEAVEKHDALNSKLFTKEEVLKDKVRDKMLEIVDEFLADLKEQDIKIKVDDILMIGSNASYNYTKDSDIDLHILANAKAADYDKEIAAALYGAYRTIFNKNLDITLYDIPLEIFVETEDSARVSNGVYSVKKNKWIKKPEEQEIPDYDKKALDTLVDKWESKCKQLIEDIKADKLKDEKKVVKLLEDIYEKLRKKGISKGEYSIENLAFKELRNKGYLDQLKDYKNELTSKRLSLEEKFDRQARVNMYNQLARAAHTQPIIQDNGMFFIYNLKASEVDNALSAIRRLPFVIEAQANENGKYDFSNTLDLAMNKMPKKYYNIRGKLNF